LHRQLVRETQSVPSPGSSGILCAVSRCIWQHPVPHAHVDGLSTGVIVGP
jgi:hypothetical protein